MQSAPQAGMTWHMTFAAYVGDIISVSRIGLIPSSERYVKWRQAYESGVQRGLRHDLALTPNPRRAVSDFAVQEINIQMNSLRGGSIDRNTNVFFRFSFRMRHEGRACICRAWIYL